MDWMQDKPGEKKGLNVSWENNKNQLFYDVLSAMRVVGGTDYISIAEQQKYFQWFSTDFVQRLVHLHLCNFLGHIQFY